MGRRVIPVLLLSNITTYKGHFFSRLILCSPWSSVSKKFTPNFVLFCKDYDPLQHVIGLQNLKQRTRGILLGKFEKSEMEFSNLNLFEFSEKFGNKTFCVQKYIEACYTDHL